MRSETFQCPIVLCRCVGGATILPLGSHSLSAQRKTTAPTDKNGAKVPESIVH